MQYLIILAVFGAIAWWFLYGRRREYSGAQANHGPSELTEQELIELQVKFEHQMTDGNDLPNSIRGKDAYIYWGLMRGWYDKLIAAKRYELETARQLRGDWAEYLRLLPELKTTQLLAREARDQGKSSVYEQRLASTLAAVERIQNAFALAIGEDSLKELQEVRGRDANAFDRSGRKPIAPEGYFYSPISLTPYEEECKPKAN
jgi:hypothetical protein